MEELVERAKNNDSDAFTHLILNIERDLYCIAKSKIDNENDIDDGVRIDIWTHFMRECIINYVH